MGVEPKIGGKPPKCMVYKGKPYERMDDLEVPGTPIFGNTHIDSYNIRTLIYCR